MAKRARAEDESAAAPLPEYTVRIDFVGEDPILNASTSKKASDIIRRLNRVRSLATGLLRLHDDCGENFAYVPADALNKMEKALEDGRMELECDQKLKAQGYRVGPGI